MSNPWIEAHRVKEWQRDCTLVLTSHAADGTIAEIPWSKVNWDVEAIANHEFITYDKLNNRVTWQIPEKVNIAGFEIHREGKVFYRKSIICQCDKGDTMNISLSFMVFMFNGASLGRGLYGKPRD